MEEEKNDRTPLNFTNLGGQVGFTQAVDNTFGNFNRSFGELHSPKHNSSDVREMLENPKINQREIVKLSKEMTSHDEYMNVVNYMVKMLTLNYVIVPKKTLNTSDDGLILSAYNKWERYLKNFRVQETFNNILMTMAIEDVFFGYERRGKEGVVVQKFDASNCLLIGRTDGLYRFAYNMEDIMDRSRVTTKEDLVELKEALSNFPNEFVKLYQNYLDTGNKWQVVSASKGVCFKWRTECDYPKPPFISLIPNVLGNQEEEDLVKLQDRLDLFKLLVQKIPFRKDARSEDDLLIDLPSVKMFHDNIKSILPKGIEIATTPMDIQDISFPATSQEPVKQKDRQEDVYSSQSKPSILLSGIYDQNAVAIIKSIEKDSAEMFKILRQFESFFYYRSNHILGEDDFFTVQFPDLTVYNIDDRRDEFQTVANFGIGKSLLFASYGYSLSDIENMVTLENDIFSIDKIIKPLTSPFNQSLKEDEGGREEKSINKLSDKGTETRDKATNITRDITS